MSCITLFHKDNQTIRQSDMASESSLSSKYQKMTDLEHILKKPDTYIGSIQLTECTEYTTLGTTTTDPVTIGLATFTHIPALYKLVDEGLVNMRDHVIRQAQAIKDGKPDALPVTCIEVEVDAATGTITMTNDGNGIDIAQHPEHKMWIPEMIFGHLRTSTNYAEDKKEKIVGGKNGFGFKLVLVWSTWGSVETVDHVRGLKYTQEFKANLTEICAPKITKCSAAANKKPYTRISFRPDYARLGIAGLSPDMTALFMKRVYDIAAVTDRSIRVKYNGTVVPIKDFKQYIGLYICPEVKRVYEAPSERWEYAVCLTNTDEFGHVSFVNGICTSKGGKHVEYVMGQLLRKLAAFIKLKKKVDVKPATIKEQLTLFLRCDVENPAFSSQTKDELTTTSANFGSACTVSDEFVEKVAKMGVMDAACALTEVKEAKAAKKTDGAKTRTIRGIPKLIDANFAGTEKSAQCTIIFCEGDSAKAGIVSGLSKEDRNTIGVYPVKGKFMNVRGEAVKRIAENTEIAEIKRILGLENGRDYTAEDVAKRLRYGKVLFMTDQDLDGSHIKGLGINLFQSEWPTLTHIPGFIGFMNTPILKARKGNQERVFYNEGEFEAWKSGGATASPVDVSTWNVKYYKGLGTSTGREFREYFEHKKIVDFAHTGEPSDDAIDLVFNKKRADDRKQWLSTYNRADHLDTSHKHVTYEDFMTREMKHFSIYDNQRSIANGMDGLKISLRKILFAAFKKGGLKTEIKVAQFSGYVSEHSGYHHGEASLNGAIIGMAQNFVGSNNINLFEPNGQYGTRLCGGRDSASERYIFTQLNAITRLIYRAEDDAILEYLDDDGQLVEPTFYAPIVPMVLVNGTKGIGTGFSTDIMCHNPLQIIDHIGNMLLQKPEAEWGPIEPYYRGFKGSITALTSSGSGGKFLIRGIHTVDAAKKQVRVTELPVGHWTEDFKKHLESLIETNLIKDYVDMSTDTVVDFTVTFPATASMDSAIVDHGCCTAIEKLLKLYTTESTSNMHLFDSQDQLKKYGNVRDIVRDYYATRLKLYNERKTHQLAAMAAELLLLSNKARYIQELLDGSIDLRRKRGDELTAMMQSKGYDHMDGDEQYKYLLKLPMDSVSEENVQKLLKEKGQKEAHHSILEGTGIEQLWLADLAELRAEYVKQEEKRVASITHVITGTGASAKKIVKAKKT